MRRFLVSTAIVGACALAACSSGNAQPAVTTVLTTTARTTSAPAPTTAVSSTTVSSTTTTLAPSTTATTTTTGTVVALPLADVPAGDAFYSTPLDVSHANPGDLIYERPITGPAGTKAFTILYVSRTVDDHNVAVSGTVIYPDGPAPSTPRPIVAWAHGTTGLGDSCATSKQFAAGTTQESLLASLVTARNAVFVSTDYQGLGTPGDHAYLVGLSEGRNVLDSARVASRVSGSGASAASKVVVWGHSQGGGAAAFAAELKPTYAPELDVVGALEGAPATELSNASAAYSSGGNFGFALMAIVGFRAAYPDLAKLDNVGLTAAGKAAVAKIGDECLGQISDEVAGHSLSDYVTSDATYAATLTKHLQENTGAQLVTNVPIFIYHGEADTTVPVDASKALLARYCALGDVAYRKTYPGQSHVGVIVAAAGDISDYLDARLRGDPAPTSC